ncbi:MAG: acetyl-CoA hydrolase [Syntrophomonadaceae bacterium]|jgi:acyl-CoA hydrolase|nr:acetyl-CoA hydrolase [Syntrophomonadaceae bacterium]
MNRWKEMYRSKLTTPDEAVKLVEPGDYVMLPFANGIPPALLEALASRLRNGDLSDIHFFGGLTVQDSSIFDFDLAPKMLLEANFLGAQLRKGTQEGVFTFNPMRLSEYVPIMLARQLNGVIVQRVAPMDKHGFLSTGTDCEYIWEVVKKHPRKPKLILEVNEYMPRTLGNNQFHISEVSAVIEHNTPLVSLPPNDITDVDRTIAGYIAEMVEDESCLQLGIGRIPNAVALFLKEKRDLGIHTEMLVDSMVDLYEAGAVTCAKKNFMPNRWVATFALGSQKLYDFIDDNPMVEMLSAAFVNDPINIAKNDRMVSVNSTLEVDLTGQCNSESIGYRQYSGTGGQLDFVQGAVRSRGGKSFLTLYSTYTDKEGNLKSRIVPRLSDGATVTVPRTDVQYVVSEYGVASLRGKHVRQRVEELINIAHPDYRDYLRSEARRMNFIP